jgi:hypothetical protein
MKNRLKAFILNIQRKLQRLLQRFWNWLNDPYSNVTHPLINTIPPILIRMTAIIIASAVCYEIVVRLIN